MSATVAEAQALRKSLERPPVDTSQSDIFFQQFAMFAAIGRQEEARVSTAKARQEAEFMSLLYAYFSGSDPASYRQFFETPRARAPPPMSLTTKQVPPSPQVATPPTSSNSSMSPLHLPRMLPVVTPTLHLSTPPASTNPKPTASYHMDLPASTYTEARSRQPAYSISSTTATVPEEYDEHYDNSPTSSVDDNNHSHHDDPSHHKHEAENRFDVVFQQQSMGMKLGYDPLKKCAVVKESFDGTESKKYTQITSGVMILSVNGLSLCGISLSKIMSRLREAQRPAVIRFERPLAS
ncbi:hypothetical protein SDRG_16332 [Saprolegnia diclina VS20]|uniref:PDZ domain-containing protein n=1 Tax=Saprolegnia diclina (strain VS20) TaxID=1156394 RepID=T0R8J5_SAPDV|nr:hypothetical protein SDRG_16332 [Saprolegnia diclina VS20]EQC25817.1 hypothetical protein SDRG_16332 [Saprolegnia diclina VS20]|eukprot:XP_008620759.1 hypothetical protein SDRG_16332 [Saprolegnia diclina VS20]